MDCSQVDTLDLSVWLSFFDYIPRFFETGLLFSLIPSLLPAAGISNSNASMRISRGRRSQAGLTKVIVNGYTKTVSRLFIILQTVSRKRAKLCNTNIAVDLRVANGPRINFVPCMVRLDARPRNYTEIPCSRMCGAFFLCFIDLHVTYPAGSVSKIYSFGWRASQHAVWIHVAPHSFFTIFFFPFFTQFIHIMSVLIVCAVGSFAESHDFFRSWICIICIDGKRM